MNNQNEFILRQRAQTYQNYGATGNVNQSNPSTSQPTPNYQNNRQQQTEQFNPIVENDPNSCGNLICEKWNLIFLVVTVLAIAFIVSMLLIYK